MKTERFSILAALAAAFALTACSVDELTEPDFLKTKTVKVNFTTENVETKTAFDAFDETSGTYPVSWTENDNVISMSMNFDEPVDATVNRDADNSGKADFSASFTDSGSPYVFYAFSPKSAVSAVSSSRKSWTVTIPTVQTPKSDGLSCDEAAMLIYAKSDEMASIPSDPIEVHFSHVTSYCRLILKNLSAAFEANSVSDPTIKTVDVTFSVPVAGSWYVDATDGSLTEKEASYTITVKPTISDLSQPAEVWFALAPCTLNDAKVTVSVNTDKGSLSREYTYGTRTYKAGAVNKLSLDMTKGSTFEAYTGTSEETVYVLVESADDLNKDDEVIFVDATVPAYAMSKTADGTNGVKSVAKDAATGFTYSTEDKYVRLPDGSDVVVFTVASKSGSSVTFNSAGGYLDKSTSGSSHYPVYNSSKAQTFTLAISSGEASLSYKSGSGKTTYSLYNKTDHFTMNSSTSSAVKTLAIYKKKTVSSVSMSDPADDPVLTKDQYGAYLSSGDIAHTPGTSQISREFASTTTTFVILYPSDVMALEFNDIPTAAAKGDTFTLALTKVSSGKKTVLGSYEVTVLKEDGAKLWLSDLKGNGFIVKR